MLRLGDLFSNGIGGGSIFLSPLWTALLTVVVILLIIWFMMSKEVEPIYNDTSFMFLLLKVGVGTFISQVVIQYLVSGSIERSVADKYKNKNQERIVARVTDVVGSGEGHLVPELGNKETKTEININVLTDSNLKKAKEESKQPEKQETKQPEVKQPEKQEVKQSEVKQEVKQSEKQETNQ